MSGVHDHDIQKAVDQLKSEGRDQYLDREPESSGSGKNKKDSNIWDLWWGIKPHHDKSKKHDKSEKPDDCKKHDKSKKPHHDKSKKPDDCKKHDKSKKPDKKPKCRHKRWEYHHYDKKKHHKSSKSGYEKYTEWYEGNVTEVKYRKV
ncbi:hypothetical protein ABD67_17555 [Bacillus sonorensis]|uniref:spore coat protein CotG n=1 Tax=Bacillus sonorensis TaxID=119858 RepID=UPI0018CE4ACA|nr:hypothetical protein [Bacillus sonorensis]MBG9916629.1 hypothetical protein [Bacillus sonorensis]